MFEHAFDAIGQFLYAGFVAMVCLVLLGGYTIYEWTQPTIIKSKVLIKPQIMLHTDGRVIDTIYLYKSN